METLYRGFDGLDVSFQGQISDQLCKALLIAKDKAQHFHKAALVEWNGLRMAVSESGARGGYAFAASTGPFGATWFFKKPNAHDPWGVRVSCNSFNLATNGLGQARAELYRTLELLGIDVPARGESIGRVDYAIDILAPDFTLDPGHFVMHSNASRADHLEISDISTHGHSGRVTSVTVGKMPGRQVIIYDKRAEVIAKHKVGWWEIWDAARAQNAAPALVRDDPTNSRIWRIELRAGKHHLKERWNVRHWRDLDNRFGDIATQTLDAIRHARPSLDSNRSRWPESDLWQLVRRETESDLFEMRLFADPDRIKRVQAEAHDQLLARQMAGLLVSRAALRHIKAGALSEFALTIGSNLASEIANNHAAFGRKLARTFSRYRLET